MTLTNFLKCNFNPSDLPNNIPIFYHQILFAWFLLNKEPQTPLNIRRELIVYNQHISIDNKYIYEPLLIKNNVIQINDFFDEDGKAWKFQNFCNRKGNLITFYKYISIIDAIPATWRKILKSQKIDLNICNINEQPMCKIKENVEKSVFIISSREIYWTLMNENITLPTCVNSWNTRMHL